VTNAFDRTRSSPHLNGAAMALLDQFEPHPTEHATTDDFIFQCACGELLTQSLPR
jgi:hypothetical protein